jgi:hypothetical protein
MLTGLAVTPDSSEVIDHCKRLQLRKRDGLLVDAVSWQVPIPLESSLFVSTNAELQGELVMLVLVHHHN